MSLIFTDCAVLDLGLPQSDLSEHQGFSKASVCLSECNEYDMLFKMLEDPAKHVALAQFLYKIVRHARWHEYFHLSKLHFSWCFDKTTYESSNPFFELFMRAIQVLFSSLNQHRTKLKQGELEQLAFSLNVAFRGITGRDSDVISVPALIWPVHVRSHAAHMEDLLILPDFGCVLLQAFVTLLVIEQWMQMMENAILEMIDLAVNKQPLHSRHDNVKSMKSGIDDLVSELKKLTLPGQMEKFIFYRLSDSNEKSDFNRLVMLVNILVANPDENQEDIKNGLRQLLPCCTETVIYGLRQILPMERILPCSFSMTHVQKFSMYEHSPRHAISTFKRIQSLVDSKIENAPLTYKLHRLPSITSEAVVQEKLLINFTSEEEEHCEQENCRDESSLLRENDSTPCCFIT